MLRGEEEKLQETEGMDDPTAIMFSQYISRTDAHMNSQRLWQHVQGLHRFKPVGVPALTGGVDTSSHALQRNY